MDGIVHVEHEPAFDVVGLYAAQFDRVLRAALTLRGFVEHPEHGIEDRPFLPSAPTSVRTSRS